MTAQAAVKKYNISTGNLSIATGDRDDYEVTGSTNSYRILVASGYHGTITLNGVSIRSTSVAPIWVVGKDNCSNLTPVTIVNFVLKGDNTLENTHADNPAFQVDQGAQIHISAFDPTDNASGKLTATANKGGNSGGGAAIGAGRNANQGTADIYNERGLVAKNKHTAGGNVIISSGTVNANGSYHGAGIGGGHWNYYGGNIVIYGGIVTSAGGAHSAGIGTGCPTGVGNDGTFAENSSIIVIPPAQITATTKQSGKQGLAGSSNITYIGDPQSFEVTVKTVDNEKKADIYADINETTSVTGVFRALGINYDFTKVQFGNTGMAGYVKFKASLKQNVTFFTDASSSNPATLGRPYKPVTTTVSAAKTVTLPLLDICLSLEPTPSLPLDPGYSGTQALTNAYRLKVTYSDTNPMTGVVFERQAGSGSDFSAMKFYDAGGTAEIPAPTSLTDGMVFYIVMPLNAGKPIGVYSDVLRFSGTWKNQPTGYIRQIVTQRVVLNDTDANTYIKVTAAPQTFSVNSAASGLATLSLRITHNSLILPYDPADVTAWYLITTQPDYDRAIAATPLSGWTSLTVPASDGASGTTSAPFTGKPVGTYYIHWHVVSGTVFAHSKTVLTPAATYGGFGPYIIDTTPPTAGLTVGGSTTATTLGSNAGVPVSLTFDKAVRPAGLTNAGFSISPAGKAAISSIAVSGSDNRTFTAVLTPVGNLYNGENFTVQLKNNAVLDVAGNSNTASNAVTVTYSNPAKPTVAFNNAAQYATLKPSFTVTVTPGDGSVNGNTDLYRAAGGTAFTGGDNLTSLFTVTPEGGAPLPPSGYTATYAKNGTAATVTFAFSADLTNTKRYKVDLAGDKFFNLLQNGNAVAASTEFLIAVPEFTGTDAGITASPNLFTNTGGTTTLTIRGTGLKANVEKGLLVLNVKCAAIGSGVWPVTGNFAVAGGMDQVTVGNVAIPANTGSTTLTYIFELYMTFNGHQEVSTGKSCSVQAEPDASRLLSVSNGTGSVSDLVFGYTDGMARDVSRRQTVTVTNNGAQTLNNLQVSFTGPDGSHFANTAPAVVTGLAPGGTSTFDVYLQTGKNAGPYAGGPGGSETKVSVSAQNGSATVTGSAALVKQNVKPKAATGSEGNVVGRPVPGSSWNNRNTVELTATATGSGDRVVDWQYAVVNTNTRPLDLSPLWTSVGGGATTATHTFPGNTEDTWYIFWKMNTRNISGITGQVKDGSAVAYHIDLKAPEVSGITTARNHTNASPVNVRVTFSEPVATPDVSRCAVTNASAGTPVPQGIPDNGLYTTYEIALTPRTGLVSGDIISFSVQAGAATDRAGNTSTAQTSAPIWITYNNENPLVTLATAGLTVNSSFDVAATFSKAVTGLTAANIRIFPAGFTIDRFSGSGTAYTFRVNTHNQPSAKIVIVVPENAVSDNAGNGNVEGELVVGYRHPADRIAGTLSYSGPAYENGAFNVYLSFPEDVTGLAAGDFLYSTADFEPLQISGSGRNYTLTFTPKPDKEAQTSIELKSSGAAVRDIYGNEVSGSGRIAVSYDTRRPQVSLIAMVNPVSVIHFDPLDVRIVFDEAGAGRFDASRLALSGFDLLGIKSGPVVAGSSTEYVVTLQVASSAVSNTHLTLQAGTGLVTDRAGNPSLAGGSGVALSVLFVDNVPPDIISMSVPPTNASPVGRIVFTFSKPLNATAPGAIWLEDVGTIPTGKIKWLNPGTISFDRGHLAEGMTYVMHVSGYTDRAGNTMPPRVFSFKVSEPAYPVIPRPVTIRLGGGLTMSPAHSDEPFYVNSRDNFTFTVRPSAGHSLDSLTVETGIPLRDREGILRTKNPDGSITVTLVRINEPYLNVSVYLRGTSASEAVEAARVWASGHRIYVRTDRTATLSVYNLNGTLCRQLTVGAGTTSEPLPQGYYTALLDGKAYKVIIH
jgi:hypothetical protein